SAGALRGRGTTGQTSPRVAGPPGGAGRTTNRFGRAGKGSLSTRNGANRSRGRDHRRSSGSSGGGGDKAIAGHQDRGKSSREKCGGEPPAVGPDERGQRHPTHQ